jgi:hypothetical protein
MSFRPLFLLFVIALLWSCSTKPPADKQTAEYTEDLSGYRPVIPVATENAEEPIVPGQLKGPYVPATHDINGEMDIVMDSVIAANQSKTFQTYTIQVYLGRSREEANLVREKVYRILPTSKPELSYKQPSWRVTLGTYLDRVDAYKTLNQLKPSFPGAALVPEKSPLK